MFFGKKMAHAPALTKQISPVVYSANGESHTLYAKLADFSELAPGLLEHGVWYSVTYVLIERDFGSYIELLGYSGRYNPSEFVFENEQGEQVNVRNIPQFNAYFEGVQ